MKKTIRKSKKKQNFHVDMEVMTSTRINSMVLLDREEYIKFLQDPITGYYIVFNNYNLCSCYARSYQAAEHFFNKCVKNLD